MEVFSENNTKTKKIKAKVMSLLLASTCHGIPNVIRSERVAFKLVWLILFLLSTVYGVTTVFDSINGFLEYEVITKIDIVPEIPSKFPTITFINRNTDFTKNNVSIADFRKNYLKDCYRNSAKCSPEEIQILQDKNSFLSYKLKTNLTFISGPWHGLYVKIAHESFSKGIIINIHNESNDPGYYYGGFHDGIHLANGYETYFTLKRVYTNKLGEPYNHCIGKSESHDSDLFKYIKSETNYSYRQRDCYEFCLGQLMIQIASKDLNLSIPFSIEHISNLYYFIDAIYPNKSQPFKDLYYNASKQHEFSKKCDEKCPRECDTIEYQVTTTFSRLPDSEINSTSFTIYYKDLEYTQISQLPKTKLFDIISNIGGLLGVFIGISFLSFAELFEIIFEIALILFERKSNQNVESIDQLPEFKVNDLVQQDSIPEVLQMTRKSVLRKKDSLQVQTDYQEFNHKKNSLQTNQTDFQLMNY